MTFREVGFRKVNFGEVGFRKNDRISDAITIKILIESDNGHRFRHFRNTILMKFKKKDLPGVRHLL